MSDKSDPSTAEEEKITEDLLALLYAAPESDHAPIATSELEDELAGFHQVRALFRDLPEEEPSIAGANQLLAQAAKLAPPAPSESPGFLAWLSGIFMPIAQYPGLAAVASLVLVAGIAGALYVDGGHKIAEPTLTSSPTAAFDDGVVEKDKNVVDDSLLDTSAVQPVEEVAVEEAATEEPKAEYGRGGKSDKAASAPGGLLSGELQLKESKKQPSRRARDKKRSLGASSILALDPQSVAEQKGVEQKLNKRADSKKRAQTPKSPKLPPPAPAKPSAVTTRDFMDDEGSAQAGVDSVAESQEDDADEAPNVSDLHRRARIAAKKGDCALVKKIGQQIRRLDSAYYDRTYLSDSGIRACRAPQKKSTKKK